MGVLPRADLGQEARAEQGKGSVSEGAKRRMATKDWLLAGGDLISR